MLKPVSALLRLGALLGAAPSEASNGGDGRGPCVGPKRGCYATLEAA